MGKIFLNGLLYFLTDDLNFCLSMSLGVWMAGRKMKKKKGYLVKFLLYICMLILWSVLFYCSGGKTGSFRLQIGIARYSFVFFITIFLVRWMFKCSWFTAMHSATVAYCLEHIAQRSSSMVWELLGIRSYAIQRIMLYSTICIVFYCGYLFFLKDSSYSEDSENEQDKIMVLLAFFVAVADIGICLTMGEVYFETGNKNLMVCEHLSTIIISILALIVGVSRVRESSERQEKNMVKQMLALEKQNYQREKAVAEVINIKCHDLKHQISNLESRIDAEELQEINRAVDEYEANLHTGNPALDMVLRNKVLLCQQKKIDFTCIADGKLLSFMKNRDIYALFGNLLDNGIEAAEKMENPDMRVISLTITEKSSMVFIHMENYYEGEIHFEDGLPKTEKEDVFYHGYGTRSVRFLSEKYDGDVVMKAEDGIFVVDIMFPRDALETNKM